MTDKATAAFGVLAEWSKCFVCHQPVEPWIGRHPSIHPTCYLIMGHIHRPGDYQMFIDDALRAFLNE